MSLVVFSKVYLKKVILRRVKAVVCTQLFWIAILNNSMLPDSPPVPLDDFVEPNDGFVWLTSICKLWAGGKLAFLNKYLKVSLLLLRITVTAAPTINYSLKR